MTLTEEDKEFLAHYGVPGMKWGVRRSQEQLDRAAGRKEARAEKKAAKKARDAPNSNYTSRMRSNDRQQYGKRGAKRINRKMNEGLTRKQAVASETSRQMLTGAIAGTAGLALIYGPTFLSLAAPSIGRGIKGLDKKAGEWAEHINTKRGRKAAATIFSDSRGIANYRTIRATYDATTGKWR